MTSPISKIAIRRLKNNLEKNIFLGIAVFFSMAIISLFVFFELQTLTVKNSAYSSLPFDSFLDKLRAAMNITVVFLVAITFAVVKIHCDMRQENNAQILAILSSIGATEKQRRMLALTDILILYLPSVLLGVISGIIPGIKIGNRFQGLTDAPSGSPMKYILTALAVFAAAMLLILLCNFLPIANRGHRTVIQSVKKHNKKANEERHGYRESQTYRSQTMLKKLARKSIEFHSKIYDRIALSFASSFLYPILAALLFRIIGNAEIVIDNNPYDKFNTSGAALSAVDDIIILLFSAFLVLTCIGLMQAVLMSRIQIAARRKSTRAYLSLGMAQSDIDKMIRLELGSVILKSIVILIFSVVFISTCYGAI